MKCECYCGSMNRAAIFVYLGIGALVCSWMEIAFWMISAENQGNRLRHV
jgi:hypothetical protein